MFTRQTFVDYTTPAVSAAWLNGMQAKIDEFVSLKDFAVVGDGVTDDTAGVQAFFDYLATNGGSGYIPVGEYLITGITLTSPTNGFTVRGAGLGSVLKNRPTSVSTPLALIGLHSAVLENFRIDAGFAETGYATSGISISDGYDVTIRDVTVQNYRNTAILIFVNTPGTSYNCHIINCTADSPTNGQNGFLLEGSEYSSIQNCRVTGLDPTGSPCYGLQLKNRCSHSYILGGYAANCKGGIAFASDTSSAGSGPDNCIVRGVIVKDCLDGAVIGKALDCFVSYHADMEDSPAGVAGSTGYALNIAGFNGHISAEVTIANVASGRNSILVRSDDAAIFVPYANVYGDNILELSAGVDRCTLTVGDMFPSTGSIYDKVSDGSGTATNRVCYLRELTALGLTGANYLYLRVPGKSGNYLSYSGTTDTFTFRANDVDILSASEAAVSPQPDLGPSLGTNGRRWDGAWTSTLALIDGVTAPSTDANHAIIYVDSADGDLKIKFGDGTVKTIVTDT